MFKITDVESNSWDLSFVWTGWPDMLRSTVSLLLHRRWYGATQAVMTTQSHDQGWLGHIVQYFDTAWPVPHCEQGNRRWGTKKDDHPNDPDYSSSHKCLFRLRHNPGHPIPDLHLAWRSRCSTDRVHLGRVFSHLQRSSVSHVEFGRNHFWPVGMMISHQGHLAATLTSLQVKVFCLPACVGFLSVGISCIPLLSN